MRKFMTCAVAALMLGFAGAAAQGAEPAPYSWQSVPFGAGGFVDGFLYHPKQKDMLYARTDIGGMYRYDFANKSWVPLLDHFGHDESELMGVLSMAVDPNNPDKLYAATGEYLHQWAHLGAVLRSDDRGQTWQKTDLSVKLGGNSEGRGSGERLVVDPKDGNILWLGTSQDGLWKSTDGGKSFSKAASPGKAISLVLIGPDGAVYAGTSDGKGGLFVSRDGGGFAAVDGAPQQTPQHAVFSPDGTLYVTFAAGDGKIAVNPNGASAGGVWAFKDGKARNISPAQPSAGGVTFGYSGIDVQGGVLVVSTLDRWVTGDDVYRSTDGGAHWTPLGAQSRHDATAYPWLVNYMNGEDKMGHWLSDIKLNPFNPDEAIYGTGYGLWMSQNLSKAGAEPIRWDFNVKNFEETATFQLTSPTGGAIVLAAFGDVGGGAWDDVAKTPGAPFIPTSESNFSVDYAGLNPSIVARTTDKTGNNGYYSEDGGASWAAFGSSPYKRQDAQGNWHSAGQVAVSAKGTSLLWVPEKQAAVYSTDKGKTWKESTGWPAGRDIVLVPVADKAIDGVFYVYDRFNNQILISIDGGASFKPSVTSMNRIEGWQRMQLAVVPGRMRDLWLAAPYGLVHSPAADQPVKAMPGVDEAWQVGFGKSASVGGYPAVYLWGKVKGVEGLWRSDDEGKTWTRLNDDAHRFGWINAISGDPLDYGMVYIAPGGRGIMMGKPK
ncbi:MAG: exo-alpha-sialidase [Asticcacaulis sp.]|uniref:exo-alpha-sialidase n=1 Tax=Asticcacaulis sp. TaxID=1872648 RepID=UPI0039E4333C